MLWRAAAPTHPDAVGTETGLAAAFQSARLGRHGQDVAEEAGERDCRRGGGHGGHTRLNPPPGTGTSGQTCLTSPTCPTRQTSTPFAGAGGRDQPPSPDPRPPNSRRPRFYRGLPAWFVLLSRAGCRPGVRGVGPSLTSGPLSYAPTKSWPVKFPPLTVTLRLSGVKVMPEARGLISYTPSRSPPMV